MKFSKKTTGNLTKGVTAISKFGFWVLCENKEYFIGFNDYPAFKNATVDKIFNLKILSPKQLYWPDIDVDIEVDALEKPDRFPLVFK
jgi:hypothetical protein